MGLPIAYSQKLAWSGGEMPVWNPFSNCGVPFLAQWGTCVLYPLSLFYILLPLPWALNVFSLGHLLLGGLGMFCLIRRWTSQPYAAALSGVLYTFNGVSLSCLIWANYTIALAWLPWIVLHAQSAWKQSGNSILWAALFSAFQMLSGAPEWVVLTWVVVSVVAVADAWDQPTLRRQILTRLMVIVFLVAGLCAAQLLPFFDLLAQSHRVSQFRPKDWAMPVWGWCNFFVPVFRSSAPSDEIPQMQAGQGFLISYYLGVGSLGLAALALITLRTTLTKLFTILALGCVWMSMGDAGWLHPWLAKAFPMLYWSQYPVKFLMILSFVIPALAGLGLMALDRQAADGSFSWGRFLIPLGIGLLLVAGIGFWGRETSDGKFPLPWVLPNAVVRGVFLVLFWIAVWGIAYRGQRAVPAFAVLVLAMVFDVMTCNHTLVPQMTSEAFVPGLWRKSTQRESFRIGSDRVFIPPAVEAVLANRKVSGVENRVLGRHLSLWSHFNLLEQTAKINGSSTLLLRDQRDVEREIYRVGNTNLEGLLDFLGVRCVSTTNNPTEWIPRPTALSWLQVGAQPKFTSPEESLGHVFSKDFDSRRDAWFPASDASELQSIQAAEGRIVDSDFRSQSVRATVDMKTPGIMTIAQSYSPYWKATVNGQPTKVLKVNHAFQAVVVPSGTSQVVLRFEDPWLRGGAAITGLTLLWMGVRWFRNRSENADSNSMTDNAGNHAQETLPKAA